MENRKHSSSDSSDDEVFSKTTKVITLDDSDSDSDRLIKHASNRKEIVHGNSHKALHQYSMQKCEFCDSIFHTRYDHFIHNAEHMAVSLTRCPIYKCPKCYADFASLQQLHHHTVTKHIRNVPDILANIVKNDPVKHDKCGTTKSYGIPAKDERTDLTKNVVEEARIAINDPNVEVIKVNEDKKVINNCRTRIKHKNIIKNDMLIKAGNDMNIVKHKKVVKNDILESILEKTPVIRCDDSVTELIKASNDKIIKSEMLESIVEKSPVIRCDDSVTKLLKASNDKIINSEMLESIVEKSPVIRCDDSVTELIKANNEVIKTEILENIAEKSPVVQCVSITKLLANSHGSKSNGKKNLYDYDYKLAQPGNIQSGVKRDYANLELFKTSASNIRSRLIFEDSDEEDDLFNNMADKVDDVDRYGSVKKKYRDTGKQKMENVDLNSVKKKDGDTDKQKMENRQPFKSKMVIGSRSDKSTDSIHYEDLLKPGLYFCKRCSMSFPNRYETYIHEVSHMRIKQRRPPVCHHCDRYIAGNYKTVNIHIARRHGNAVRKKLPLSDCPKCGLKYHNYHNHSQLYHYIYKCHRCGTKFQKESDKDEHEENLNDGRCLKVDDGKYTTTEVDGWNRIEAASTKPEALQEPMLKPMPEELKEFKYINVCEICSMFIKYNHGVKYILVGEFSEVGRKQQCSRCGKECFEVKRFRASRRRIEKKEARKSVEENSNEHRLKNIRQRLKTMNKLRRFYLFLFYCRYSRPHVSGNKISVN